MIKRIIIIGALLAAPFILGLLFTYDILKIEWVSFMEIQPSYRAQEDPRPLPANSVPIQGAVMIAGNGAPENPVQADDVSVQRGEQLFSSQCSLCHGPQGVGNGQFAAFLANKPTDLTSEPVVNLSDGELFAIITNGIPGAMPPFRGNLPQERNRWDVINFVRSLQGNE